MEELEGNTISIGDRVKVLWNFDNRMHMGKIIGIKNNVVTIASNEVPENGFLVPPKITISDHSKIFKLPE
ncbi:MAG: hypothetical protein SCH39_11940 [Methanosarcinales archaeon]|nr:hypothetical protein [ANME-2 cluster archaeon]MDW7777024.1 hypothetical protein [Methanosarcinales archaeon]